MNGREVYREYISKILARFAPWNEDKIKSILRENFASFDPAYISQYTACLQKAWEREAAESREQVRLEAERIRKEEAAKLAASPEEIERRSLLAIEQYGPEICPTCGEKTVNHEGWWSGVYRMPGWLCAGKPDHFLKWARENRR